MPATKGRTSGSRSSFRVHPKGVGILCTAPDGLPPNHFVADYLGELYPPWRWFERQDIAKKHHPHQELPDFYNICLERPKEDPDGYDVLFVEAARRSSFASRLCHSCDPNCHIVVMSAQGRLTLAVYTTRQVGCGEELCWDYACVTESEKEFRAATCLCGTGACRGSFLYYANSATFTDVIDRCHTVVDRIALVVRAGSEALTPEDEMLLRNNGLRTFALSIEGEKGRHPAPPWLLKWAALALRYIEEEAAALPVALLRNRFMNPDCPEAAADRARGIRDSRLQHLVITLNKVLYCLRQPRQTSQCPLTVLSEPEVLSYLWTDTESIRTRWLKAAQKKWKLRPPKKAPAALHSAPASERSLLREVPADIFDILQEPCCTGEDARARLRQLSAALRRHGPVHTPAADLLLLYGRTRTYARSTMYVGFQSPPIVLADLPSVRAPKQSSALKASKPPKTAIKKYPSGYIWGQLVSWYKQTIYDPGATLSASRRGTASLPDPESAYVPSQAEGEREAMLAHLQHSPSRFWPVTWRWSFRNPQKVYGSPILDDALALAHGESTPLPDVLAELRSFPS